ncbi:two-component sensor histidine kinase [Paenibacillus selenitireducens]|uniref:histidine kinase n=1 Tax=Paenibacillus selenitireducens TaxID=1324314 RepID=A0A1T2XN11_9BACL|nr:HAMP domain-containing sensor histidine kinase [Paenibacillus selenitireducens]OPA81254.1 two-component sensor histidine kinase [Paenibacillus selenitireducens]
MISRIIHLLNIKKSIRGALLLRYVLSLVATSIILILWDNIKDQFAFTFAYIAYLDLVWFVVLFIFLFFLFSRSIVQYVMRLADGLHVISQGDLTYRVPVKRKDELGKVAESINVMAESLQIQQENERQQERAKMELITGISHDLRTPLTSIIGYLDLLSNKSYQDEAEQERFIQNTYKKAIQLQHLIDDLFEYTRLTSSEVVLQYVQLDVRELLEQMLVEFEPIAQEHHVELTWELGSDPAFTSMDSEKIIRAIDNLLINALKFSIKPGVIHVSFAQYHSDVIIRIENDGKPITRDQEQHIFERFYKVDDARSSSSIQTGSGLGLSITKNIVELHGGTISFQHQAGHFTFTIRLPKTDASDSSTSVI